MASELLVMAVDHDLADQVFDVTDALMEEKGAADSEETVQHLVQAFPDQQAETVETLEE